MASPLQPELKIPDLKIDNTWTLFLDRDGVINYERPDDYVRNINEYAFYPDVLGNFSQLARKFGKIIIVSNQKGVGKGLMSEDDLNAIHQHVRMEIEKAGGRIDAIYTCTSVDSMHPDRKPNAGMAFRAKTDFPGIEFTRSLIVGNKPSDMLFGRKAGMFTVYLATTHPEAAFPHPDVDFRFKSFEEFVKAL